VEVYNLNLNSNNSRLHNGNLTVHDRNSRVKTKKLEQDVTCWSAVQEFVSVL